MNLTPDAIWLKIRFGKSHDYPYGYTAFGKFNLRQYIFCMEDSFIKEGLETLLKTALFVYILFINTQSFCQ